MTEAYAIKLKTKKGGKIDPGAAFTAQRTTQKYLEELRRTPTVTRETDGITITGNYTLEEIEGLSEKIAKRLSTLEVTLSVPGTRAKPAGNPELTQLRQENSQLTKDLEKARSDYATLEGMLDAEITISKDTSREEKFAAIFKEEEGSRFTELETLYAPAAAKAKELGIRLESVPDLVESAQEDFADTPKYHQLHAEKREVEKGLTYLQRHARSLVPHANEKLREIDRQIHMLRLEHEKVQANSTALSELIAPLKGKHVHILYDFISQKIILPCSHDKNTSFSQALQAYIEDRLQQTGTAYEKNEKKNGTNCVIYSLKERPSLDDLFLSRAPFSKLGITLGIEVLGSRTYDPLEEPFETRVEETSRRVARAITPTEPRREASPDGTYDMNKTEDVLHKADDAGYAIVRKVVVDHLAKIGTATQESLVQHAHVLYALSESPGNHVTFTDLKEKIEEYLGRHIEGKELTQYRNRIMVLKQMGIIEQAEKGAYTKKF